MVILNEKVEQELREWWESCQDDRRRQTPLALAVVQAFKAVEAITEQEAEIWRLRIEHECPEVGGRPGEHNGGRSWCAYCGNLP